TSSRVDGETGFVAPILPCTVVGADLVVAECGQHEVRESGAHAGLAVRDGARLWPESGVRVELLELVGVAQRPVILERVLPEDVHRARDVAAAGGAFFDAGELRVAAHVEEPGIAGTPGRQDGLL